MLALCSVAEDIPRADEVRALVKDLWDLRIAKLRKSVDHMITEQETFGKVSVAMPIVQQCHQNTLQCPFHSTVG